MMKTLLNRQLTGCLSVLFMVFAVTLQAQNITLKPVSDTYVLRNVNVVTAPGNVLSNTTVLIRDGLIHEIGQNITIPVDAISVDADSMMVYAGFIDGMGHTGIPAPKEENNRRNDVKDPGNPPNDIAGITPEQQVMALLDNNEKSVAAMRKLGFTMAHTVPYGRMLPGQGSIILLGGNTSDGMMFRENVSMFSQLEGNRGVYPSTIIGVMAKYREIYRQAELNKRNASLYAQNPQGMARPSADRVEEAFMPVINGAMPVMFNAPDVKTIQRVLNLQSELGFRLMLAGVKQGWDATNDIKKANAPVFIGLDMPEWKESKDDSAARAEWSEERKELEKRKEDVLRSHYTLPATYAAAGITFGFSTMGAKESDIHNVLVKMKDTGVSENVLLAALTTSPASLLGLSRVAGTVEKGKLANLVVTDRNYFDKDAEVRYVFVEGKLYEFEKKPEKKSNGKESNDVSGTWSYSAQTPNGTGTGKIIIKKEQGGYTGQIRDGQSGYSFDLADILVDGNRMTFEFMYNDGANELPLKVEVDLKGSEFSGLVDGGPIGRFPITGQKDPKN